MSTVLLVTADELLAMPKDEFRYELIRGVLTKMSPAGCEHGRIGAFLTIHLGSHVLSRGLGEVYGADTGFRLEAEPDTVLSPDVAFVSNQRVATILEPRKYVPFAPDLAFEVLSPSDTYSETSEKIDEWLAGGARAVVLVDPRRHTVTIHRSHSQPLILTVNEVLEIPDVVPGWSLPVAQIFNQF